MMRKLLIKLLGGYTEGEMINQSSPRIIKTPDEIVRDAHKEWSDGYQPDYEPSGQTYFKRYIMARFMTAEQLRAFHDAYAIASRRRNLPRTVKTYRAEVIRRIMPEYKYKAFNQKYQDAKTPTTLNLHYGHKMKELIREVVREELGR